MGEAELVGVGKTALGVALVRAHESHRPDRLFDDPYAAAFVAAAPTRFPGRPRRLPTRAPGVGAAFAASAVLRTRFFDDYLRQAAATGCGQVVLLAAGLDTRAYRLAWPAGTHLFELDLPADLRDDWDAVSALPASTAPSRPRGSAKAC